MGDAIELIDALESAGRAFDLAQAQLYEATRLSDVRRIVRHEGQPWGIVDRQLYLHDGVGWRWWSYADGGGKVAVRVASDTLSVVVEHDDDVGCTAHVVTTALRDDAGARREMPTVGR